MASALYQIVQKTKKNPAISDERAPWIWFVLIFFGSKKMHDSDTITPFN